MQDTLITMNNILYQTKEKDQTKNIRKNIWYYVQKVAHAEWITTLMPMSGQIIMRLSHERMLRHLIKAWYYK